MRRRLLKLLSLSLLITGYEISLVLWLTLGQPPLFVKTHFYSLAWWPFIILIETLAELLWNRSLLWDKPSLLLILALASIPFWVSYEIINVATKNWIYVGLSQSPLLRWIGYAIAYASVLPAIWTFLDLQRPAVLSGKIPPQRSRWLFITACGLGSAELLFCLLWPTTFYPLAWIFLFFLTEPFLLLTNPEKSYVAAWSQKSFGLTFKTAAAGLLAGLFWEFLNWKAGAKWIYTLPSDVAMLKIFEMPILGFLGFGAFAFCAQSFSNLIAVLIEKKKTLFWISASLTGGLVCIIGFVLIDAFTWIRSP